MKAEPCLCKHVVAVVLASLIWCAGEKFASAAEEAGNLANFIRKASGVETGLCVHLGATDGTLDAQLARGRKLLVHGLAAETGAARRARQHIEAEGLYGQVSVEEASFEKLPYDDNLVNLVVVDDFRGVVSAGFSLDEVIRVLCPRGVALIGDQGKALSEKDVKSKLSSVRAAEVESVAVQGGWIKVVKRRPKEMDVWTHHRHGPSGNPVSQDTLVKPPTGPRWLAGPRWPKGHRKRSGIGLYSAGGKLLYGDNAGILYARDAFNGLTVWRRDAMQWPRRWPPPGGPIQSLVIGDGKVFALRGGKIVALDLHTGEQRASYPVEGKPADKDALIFDGGILYSSLGDSVNAIDTRRGGTSLWSHRKPTKESHTYIRDMVYGEGKLLYLLQIGKRDKEKDSIVCLNAATGRELWSTAIDQYRSDVPKQRYNPLINLFSVVKGAVVAKVGDRSIYCFNLHDGKFRWKHITLSRGSHEIPFHHGLIWAFQTVAQRAQKHQWIGIDIETGKVAKTVDTSGRFDFSCSRESATVNYFINTKEGDFFAWDTGEHNLVNGTSMGACGFASVPANGLLYSGPSACGCYQSSFRGVRAMVARDAIKADAAGTRLVKGSGRGKGSDVKAGDWPMHRSDAERSARAGAAGPAALNVAWKAQLDRSVNYAFTDDWELAERDLLTPPTVAGGVAYAAVRNAHQVVAVDTGSGREIWRFTADARVDAPPTISNGLCLFGSRDGSVYCLSAQDGTLAWKFRVAPEERLIIAYGQLESIWPITGSVLVMDGVAYAAAGHHSIALEGGIYLCALDVKTGAVVWEKNTKSLARIPFMNSSFFSDGKGLFFQALQLDPKTAKLLNKRLVPQLPGGALGLLDSSWRNGIYTSSQRVAFSTHQMRQKRLDRNKVGNLLAFDGDNIFGNRGIRFADDPKHTKNEIFSVKGKWSVPLDPPATPLAMVLAGDRLYVAGQNDSVHADKGGFLWTLSPADGKKLREMQLKSPPVYDGMAIAGGKLYISTQDGTLVCIGATQ